jgi:RNase P subunit RPR2
MERQKVPKDIKKTICPNCQLAYLREEAPGEEKQ